MVKIRPFTGYLANTNYLKEILSFPYDVLDSTEARRLAYGNPKSFLHCNKPEIDLPVEHDPYDDAVYQKGRTNLLSFI